MNYDVIAYGTVCRDVKLYDLPVFFKSIYLGIQYLEVVEEKKKIRWSSFFLLYDFETSPK
jgi:hypothetical protein